MLKSKIYSSKSATFISYLKVDIIVQCLVCLKENQPKFNILRFECFAVFFSHEIRTVSIFLAQQITTKTDLRCFEKLGPEEHNPIKYLLKNKVIKILN